MATTLAAAAAAFQKQAEELGAWLAAPGDAAPIKWESGLQSAFASLIERMCDADSGSSRYANDDAAQMRVGRIWGSSRIN